MTDLPTSKGFKLFSFAIFFLFFVSLVNASDIFVEIPDESFSKYCIGIGLTTGGWIVDPQELGNFTWYCSKQGSASNSQWFNQSTYGRFTSNTGASSNGFMYVIVDLNETYTFTNGTSKLNFWGELSNNAYPLEVILLNESYECLWGYDVQNTNPADLDGISNHPCYGVISTRLSADKGTTTFSNIEVDPEFTGGIRYIAFGGSGAGNNIDNYIDKINLTSITAAPIPPIGGNVTPITDETRAFTSSWQDGEELFNNGFYVILFLVFIGLVVKIRRLDLALLIAGSCGIVGAWLLTGDFTQMVTSATMIGLSLTMVLVRAI